MARRKLHTKKLKKQIFIIGEGITEQIYFNQLKQFENLKIKIKPELPYSTDITGIVRKARNLLNASPANTVYCIIDLDRILSNTTEAKKYKKLKSDNKGITFIEVNPCFELWVLLHFEYSARDYNNNCKKAISFLKKHKSVSDYVKTEKYLNNKDLYSLLRKKIEDAVSNSIKLETVDTITKCEVYKLIETLKII